MRFLLFLGLMIGGTVASLPWINAWMDGSGLAQDAAYAPEASKSNSAIHAGAIAHHLLKSAKERGAALTAEGLHIEVEAASKGVYSVENGVLKFQPEGQGPQVPVQKAIIQVRYDQPIYLGLTKHVEFTVEAKGIGDGGPSTFPPSGEREADAQAPAAPAPE